MGVPKPACRLTTSIELSRSVSEFRCQPNAKTRPQMFYLDQIFYKFTINLTKLSVLFLYLRIFSQRWFRITCSACAAVVGGYGISSIFATVFQCTPVVYAFNKQLQGGGHCINTTAFWYANAIYNIITDVIILASVPGVVWSLSLSTRQRIGLTLVFGLGIFVFATSILRFTTLDVASKAHDTTFGTLKSTMWTTIEASTAVICACLPMVRTPIQRLFPRIFPTAYGAGTTPSGTPGSLGGSKPYEALQSPTWQPGGDVEMGETRREREMQRALNSPMTRDASTMGLPPTPTISEGETTVAEDWSPSRRPVPPPKA